MAGLLLSASTEFAQAQQTGRIYRIAFVTTVPPDAVEMSERSSDRHAREFFTELRRRGYVQGENLLVEVVSVNALPYERLPGLAHDVVSGKPDLIVALSNLVVRELQKATTSIPIVAVVADPVAYGNVPSLARPGGNVTGVSVDTGPEIWPKRLELLKECVPGISKVGLLVHRQIWDLAESARLREFWEKATGISLVGPPLDLTNEQAEYRRVITAMAQQGANGLMVSEDAQNYVMPNRQWIADLAKDFRLPSIYVNREQVEVGGLMAYTLDGYALWRHVAGQIADIFGGTKPGEISFYQPRKFDLIINLRTAKALGLTIPPSLLARADEVIE